MGTDLQSTQRERLLRIPNQIRRVLWIYVLAFVLAAFSVHSRAAEGDGQSKDATTVTKDPKELDSKSNKKDKKDKKDKKGKDMKAIFETSMGQFKVKLFAAETPKTVDNFVGLAEGTKEFTDPKSGKKVKRPYYDGIKFHRIIPGFMVQTGDPLGNGSGGPGYTIPDEIHPELKHSKAGILSMAKTRMPNSGGSQFFITVGPTPHLDGVHSVFGEVIEGYSVIEAMSKVRTNPSNDAPLEDVVIKSIKIER
jgi:peptidyl-prolyl cis-trans isomerase A (cyclophilin A)